MSKFTVEVDYIECYGSTLNYFVHVAADNSTSAQEEAINELLRTDPEADTLNKAIRDDFKVQAVYPGYCKRAVVLLECEEVRPIEFEEKAPDTQKAGG
jgi:hypothetical protein